MFNVFKCCVDHCRYNGVSLFGLCGIVVKSYGFVDSFVFPSHDSVVLDFVYLEVFVDKVEVVVFIYGYEDLSVCCFIFFVVGLCLFMVWFLFCGVFGWWYFVRGLWCCICCLVRYR